MQRIQKTSDTEDHQRRCEGYLGASRFYDQHTWSFEGRIRYFRRVDLVGKFGKKLSHGYDTQGDFKEYRPWLCVMLVGQDSLWFQLTHMRHVDSTVRLYLDASHFSGGASYTGRSYIYDADSYVVMTTEQVLAMSNPPRWEHLWAPTRLNQAGRDALATYFKGRLLDTKDRGHHRVLWDRFAAPLQRVNRPRGRASALRDAA